MIADSVLIKTEGLEKAFGKVQVLKGITTEIHKGEVVVIIGPSGSGKSTFLRTLNLLEEPTGGKIYFEGVDITDPKININKHRQKMGMVFQQFNLFPHMTVLKNMTLAPMKLLKLSKADAEKRATELLDRVGLADRANAYPNQLSGGQKQRVAIARALAAETHYLLCDEATSALDPDTTRSVLELLKKINRTLGVTIIVITHEMKVIDSICDRVAVLDNSTVAEIGDVRTVFANPKSDIAKKLIMPQGELPVTSEHGKKIRIIYNGENSSKSLLSDMILKCSTPVNILHADTKDIDGKAYGQILVQLPDDDTSAEKITAYLKANNVTYSQV